MRRRRMSRTHSKRLFRKTSGYNRMNFLDPRRMRGGIRL